MRLHLDDLGPLRLRLGECEWVRESTCDPERAHNTHHHPLNVTSDVIGIDFSLDESHAHIVPSFLLRRSATSLSALRHAEGARVLPTFFAIWPKLEIFAIGRAATRWVYGVRERVSKRQKTQSSLRHFRSLSVQPEGERGINETHSRNDPAALRTRTNFRLFCCFRAQYVSL